MSQDVIQNIISLFVFNSYEIAVLVALLLLIVVQLFFYFYYYRRPYAYAQRAAKDEKGEGEWSRQMPKVSVIISSENESDSLAVNLPLILEQNYPDFEVIVVNNGSTDESDHLLQSLQLKYPHLYHTYVPSSSYDKAFGRRKLALTVGIKAAKGEVLLFVEPYGKPMSSNWISEMVEAMVVEGKDVALGYSFYNKASSFYNRIARFDNHLFSMQYLSMALLNKPFTGVYRNVAFKRHLFFDNKGFASFLILENGEDVFINQIVNSDNTAVCVSADSFVETTLSGYKIWKQIKKDYSVAHSCFKAKISRIFTLEYALRYVILILALAAVVYSSLIYHWGLMGLVLLLFTLKLIAQLVITNKSAKCFRSGKFVFSFPLLEFLQPIYNLKFRTRSRRLKGRR